MDDPSNESVLERELNTTQRTAIMAILTASAIATNYILIGVVNVKLMKVGGIARAQRLSKATMRNIRQNLFFAIIYNALGIPLAAGLLYPFFGLLLSPIIAAAAMTFSSVSVILNALRLRRVDL